MATIPGVPETITKADYRHLIESVGLGTDELVSLRFAADGIYAEVFALDGDGRRVFDKTADAPAMHTVFVRVVDE